MRHVFLFRVALITILIGCGTPKTTPQEAFVARLIANAELYELDGQSSAMGVYELSDSVTLVAGGSKSPTGGKIWRLSNGVIEEEDTPPGPALWWIWGHESSGVWACGDQGRILRRHPSGAWMEEASPLSEDTILFGGWHNGTDVNLVVGGSYRRDGQQNIVLTRRQNGEWQQLSIPDPPEPFTFFKVWGENPTWIVGDRGWVLKLDASENQYFQTPTGQVLFTVHGHQQDVFAVGGQTKGEIYGLLGTDVLVQQVNFKGALNGIFVRDGRWQLAAGSDGGVMVGHRKTWMAFPNAFRNLANRTIHATSARHQTFFVGGDLTRLERGFILEGPLPPNEEAIQ